MHLVHETPLRQVGGRGRALAGTIALSIVVTVIVSLVLAGVGLYEATRESDAVSMERQSRMALHSIHASVDDLALQQETVAIWDDAAEKLAAPRLDKEWIHQNIGEWLYKIFGHDEVFILDASNRVIYAASRGSPAPTGRFDVLAPDLEILTNDVRRTARRHLGVHDRAAGRALPAKSTALTTDRPTHDSHILLVGGRPAAASAMLMQPSSPGYVRSVDRWPILISIRYIDGTFLQGLGRRQLISAPRFSGQPTRGQKEHAVPLQNEQAKTVGYLVWTPELPGTRIMWNLVPLNLLVLLGLTLFMILLGRRLSKAANELSAAEKHAAHLAYHDSLTGLPNRAWFQYRIGEQIIDGRAKNAFALILLDVDDFKITNDTLGHDAGDAVLVSFAERLKLSVRSGDLVARLGGDEFALILTGMRGDQLAAYSQDLLVRLREPVEHRGQKIQGRASIGASSCAASGDAREMLKHADLALYEAKAFGGGTFRVYDPVMWSSMQLRQEMLSVAHAALEGDFIRPFYQPKIDLTTGRIVGFEALLRCCVPGQPAKGPECIMAALEDAELAVKLSDRMIDQIITDLTAWRSSGLFFGHVAINAASADLRHGDYATRLLDKLDMAGIPTECVQVEITESVLIGRGADDVERTFRDLAERGVLLALDDFGTGFASLTHLKRFPIEIIKIDRSFIRELQVDAEDGAIVDALIGLGKALGIQVVAEGIETVAQRDFLQALGCATGQGFLFGRAMPAESVANLLRRPRRRLLRTAA